eukprot:6572274-Pyramimonas_sp.AAC.1
MHGRSFVDTVRERKRRKRWTGVKHLSEVPLRARQDAPSGVRRRNKAFGMLRTKVHEHMKNHGLCRPSMKLGSKDFKGILYSTWSI